MASKSDLNTTAIENLEENVESNTVLLQEMSDFLIKENSEDVLASLNQLLLETKITNTYLRAMVGEQFLDSDLEDR